MSFFTTGIRMICFNLVWTNQPTHQPTNQPWTKINLTNHHHSLEILQAPSFFLQPVPWGKNLAIGKLNLTKLHLDFKQKWMTGRTWGATLFFWRGWLPLRYLDMEGHVGNGLWVVVLIDVCWRHTGRLWWINLMEVILHQIRSVVYFTRWVQ